MRRLGDQKRSARAPDALQLVAFTVGDGGYALDIMRIKEIVNPVKVTAVPKAPNFIEGVIELRGAILPIVDLRRRFDLPVGAFSRATKFIIVGIDTAQGEGDRQMMVGLVVDSVAEQLRVAQDQLRPPPPLSQGDTLYFSGVVHLRRPGVEDRIYLVLDIDTILSSKEKISLAGLGGAR